MTSRSSSSAKGRRGGDTEIASWDVTNTTKPILQDESGHEIDAFLQHEWPPIVFEKGSAPSYYYKSQSFNTSEIPTPDNKCIYKDCGTDPVNDGEQDKRDKKDEEGEDNEEDGNNHIGPASQSKREKRSIARARAKIHETVTLNKRVVAQRIQVRELQSQIKQKREEELEQRVELMQTINTFCAHIEAQRDPKVIEIKHEQLQLTTDAYMELERKLAEEEHELQQRELDLNMALGGLTDWLEEEDEEDPDHEYIGSEEGEAMEYENEDVDSYDALSYTETMHPHLIEYLERIGDVGIYEERLSDLYQEYREVLERQEVRRRVNLALDDESQEFLDSYEEERNKVEAILKHINSEVHRLQELCEAEGLLNNKNNRDNGVDIMDGQDDYYYYYDDDDDDDDDIGMSKAIEQYQRQPMDPLKAKMDENLHTFFEPQESNNSGNGAAASGKFDRCTFINKWLLHQLRHSSLEISRLKSQPELDDWAMHDINDASISQQALEVWYSDDMEMAEAPASPSLTEYPASEYPEPAPTEPTDYPELDPVDCPGADYAEAYECIEPKDCAPSVSPTTAPGNDSQGSITALSSKTETVRNRSQSEPLARIKPWVSVEAWVSAHEGRHRSCTIL